MINLKKNDYFQIHFLRRKLLIKLTSRKKLRVAQALSNITNHGLVNINIDIQNKFIIKECFDSVKSFFKTFNNMYYHIRKDIN